MAEDFGLRGSRPHVRFRSHEPVQKKRRGGHKYAPPRVLYVSPTAIRGKSPDVEYLEWFTVFSTPYGNQREITEQTLVWALLALHTCSTPYGDQREITAHLAAEWHA